MAGAGRSGFRKFVSGFPVQAVGILIGIRFVAVRIVQSAVIAPRSRNNGICAFPYAVYSLISIMDTAVDDLYNILPFHKACPVISVVIGYRFG
ncbi:hypothetical protein D3C75_751900 [compost metagenome]